MIDDFNREALGIEVDFYLPAIRVIRVLDQLVACRDKPSVMPADNGPELIRNLLLAWSANHQIHIAYIQPSTPQQDTYLERYNGIVKYEWLSQHYWYRIKEVKTLLLSGCINNNYCQCLNLALSVISPKQQLPIVA